MFNSVLEIILGILGLSLVVLVHEGGHFAAARFLKIRVETFSIGFGRRLAGFRRKGTDFRVSLVPLGGYCRFAGEDSFRKALEDGLDTIPAVEGEFYEAAPWRRILVSLAGPLANVVFAIIVFSMVNWIGYDIQYHEPYIGLYSEISGNTGPADRAGLETGDLILAVDNAEIESFGELRDLVSLRPGETIEMTVLRDGREIVIPVVPDLDRERGLALVGIYNLVTPEINRVIPGSVADLAGLEPGDLILSVDGKEISDTEQFFAIGRLEGREKALAVGVMRDGSLIELTYDFPAAFEQGSSGFSSEYLVRRSDRMGPIRAIGRGFADTGEMIERIIRGLAMLFRGIRIRNALSGPIRMIQQTGDFVLSGFSEGLGPGLYWSFSFFAFISLSLAVMNLLPIPVLDGGQILLFITEWLRSRPFRPGTVYRYQFVGTIIVLIIFVAASTGDVLFFSGR